MVLVPPIKSRLNALVVCVSHCFSPRGQGHVKISVSYPVSPLSDFWGHAFVYSVLFIWIPLLFVSLDVVSGY